MGKKDKVVEQPKVRLSITLELLRAPRTPGSQSVFL